MTPLTESSRWNRLHPRVGLYRAVHFFPAGETTVKNPPLDYEKIHERRERGAREARTVLSEPSTPPSSALRYLTFSTPFILYSSVTERERSAPVSARAAARLTLGSTRSRPLWSEQLFCFTERSVLRKVIMCSHFLTRRGRVASVLPATLNPACSDDGNRPANHTGGCRTADVTQVEPLQQLPPWVGSLGRRFIITHVDVPFYCQCLLSGCSKIYQKAALKWNMNLKERHRVSICRI